MNLGIKLALEAEGFTQAQITQIEAAMPAILRLLAAYKAASPDISAVISIAEMIINQVKGK